jgi:hypothetical protein
MKKLKMVIRDNVRALLGIAEGQASVQSEPSVRHKGQPSNKRKGPP